MTLEALTYEEARERELVEARDLSWDEVMTRVRAGDYGDIHDVRRTAVDHIIALWGEDSGYGISSSDINHTIYGMVRSGELRLDG